MQKNRDSFIFYRSFFEATEHLNSEQTADLFRAICNFALNQTETKLEPLVNSLFCLIKPQLQANYNRFKNGQKGGRPETKTKPNRNQTITKQKPNHNQTETKTKPNDNQTITKPKPNNNVNVNENVNNNENQNVNENQLENSSKEEFSLLEKIEVPKNNDCQYIFDFWNRFVDYPICKKAKLPKVIFLTDKRIVQIKARLKKYTRDQIIMAIENIANSNFLLGENKARWRISFDFLFRNDNNIGRVLENAYGQADKQIRTADEYLESELSKSSDDEIKTIEAELYGGNDNVDD